MNNLKAVKYEVIRTNVFIEERSDGKWAVTDSGYVLNKAGEWESEPMPSGRTDEFIEATRFNSPYEAHIAYLNRKHADE